MWGVYFNIFPHFLAISESEGVVLVAKFGAVREYGVVTMYGVVPLQNRMSGDKIRYITKAQYFTNLNTSRFINLRFKQKMSS